MLTTVLQADRHSLWQGPERRSAVACPTQVQVWVGLLSVLIEVRWILTRWIAYSPFKTDSATVNAVMQSRTCYYGVTVLVPSFIFV